MNVQDTAAVEQRLKAAYAERLAGIDDAALRPIPDGDTPDTTAGGRRQRGHWLLIAAAACIVVIASVVVALATAGDDHQSPTQPGQPSGSFTPTPVPSSTSGVPSSPSPTRSAKTSTHSSTSAPPTLTGAARWSGAVLVITGHSLGGVQIGMTIREAARAAGVPAFEMVGDGVLRPTNAQLYEHPYLYLSNFTRTPASSVGGEFACVGAATGSTTSTQVVTTEEGLRLGDPAARVRRIYGKAARFVPLPTTGGLDPRAGYVVRQGRYDLVFKLDQNGTHVAVIAGGLAPISPSECVG